jgi:hypothetical protein
MVCVTAGSDLQSFGGDCFARGWWDFQNPWVYDDLQSFGGDFFTRGWRDFQIPWVSDDAYGPHCVHKAAVAGLHMNVALPPAHLGSCFHGVRFSRI